MTQNNSTKDIETKSKKNQSRRSNTKHPALQKKFNLKMRQDYIETDYINGVKNKDGELVIRPLNEEEKTFLNSFYEEVIGANFMHDDILKELHKELKILKSKKELTVEEEAELMKLQLDYYARADDVLLYPESCDQKKLYGENNARNRCLYNRTKTAGILDELNDGTYDEFHNNIYNDPNTAENLLINTIEPKLKTILRKKKKTKDNQKT